MSGKGKANGNEKNNNKNNNNNAVDDAAKPKRRSRRGGRNRNRNKKIDGNDSVVNGNSDDNVDTSTAAASSAAEPVQKNKNFQQKIQNNNNNNNNDEKNQNQKKNNNINNNNKNNNAAAASSAAPSSAPLSKQKGECRVCFEQYSISQLFRVELCGVRTHLFCRECHSTHLLSAISERRSTPLLCMMSECNAAYSFADASLFLSANDSALFSELERRWKAGSLLRFCASATCGKDHVMQSAAETRFVCGKCNAANCAQCRTLWHAGLTCEKFQALPEKQRAPEDAHLHKLAHKEGWRQCPRCKNMIAKNADDCKFLRCKCGCGFCFACGVEYKSLVATDTNEHGEPGCRCGLWDWDDEYDADEIMDMLEELQAGTAEYWAFVRSAVHRRMPVLRDAGESDDDSDEDNDGHVPRQRLRVFEDGEALNDLVRDTHTTKVCDAAKSNTCWGCSREFESANGLETHIATTTKHAVLACCGVVFANELELAVHRSVRIRGPQDGYRMVHDFDDANHTHPTSTDDVYAIVENAAFPSLDIDDDYYRDHGDDDEEYEDDDDDDRLLRILRKRRRRRDMYGRLRVAAKLLDGRCPHCTRQFTDPAAAYSHLIATSAHVALVCCNSAFATVGAFARHINAAAEQPLCSCGRPLGHGNARDDDDDEDEYDEEEDEEEYDDDEDESDGHYSDEYYVEDRNYRGNIDEDYFNIANAPVRFELIDMLQLILARHRGDEDDDDDDEHDDDDDDDDEDDYDDQVPGHINMFDVLTFDHWPSNKVRAKVMRNECPYCERIFTSLQGLQSHLRETRQHNVFGCCGRLFQTVHDLRRHQELD